MSKTNIGLVKYVKAQVGKPYWYGCFGQMSTRTLYASKKGNIPPSMSGVALQIS